MAYVPSSDVPSAFLISTDADSVLLDLLGTFVLLDGGSEKVSFTKHVRQIDANIISAPTKAALTNAVELNKGTVVPLVGNIPSVKSTGSDNSVASLLKCIEKASEGRPAITPTRFNPKYEPIVISKSLRTGRLELIVLAGEAKEIEALQKAVESGDEQTIEKVASNNGTISVLVWFPAKATDPIKRVLHTGTAPLSRIISALEKAKGLPYLHSPVVSAANAYKEVAAPKNATNAKAALPARTTPSKPVNNTVATKPTATRRPVVPAASHAPSSRPNTTTSNKPAPSTVKASPSRPPATAPTRTRPASTVAAKPLANKNSAVTTARKTNNNEAPIQKTTVGPLKGAAMSRASAAVGKAVGAVTGKTASTTKPSGNVSPPKTEPPVPAITPDVPASPPAALDANSVAPNTSPTAPIAAPGPEEVKEPATTPVEPMPSLNDSVVCLDDIVPDISVDAPQDPASSDLRPPVELIVIPPTPEPRPPSARSSIDGTPSSPVGSHIPEGEKELEEQLVFVSADDDQRTAADAPSPTATTTATQPNDQDPATGHDHLVEPVPAQPRHDSDFDRTDTSSEHPVPTAPERTPSPEPEIDHGPLPGDTTSASDHETLPGDTTSASDHELGSKSAESGALPDHTFEPKDKEPVVDHSQDISTFKPTDPTPQNESGDIPAPRGEDPSDMPEVTSSPTARDLSPVTPIQRECAPAEPFVPPIIRCPSPASSDIVLKGNVPEEFKGPHVPQEVGENGLLDDLEEPPKLMKISMDTDDLKNALEKGAAAVADQLAHSLDTLSLNASHSEKDDISDRTSPEGQAEIARKISAQMIEDASTPFASALASSLVEGVDAAKKAAHSALDDLVDLANTVSETVVDGVKEAADQVNEKMKAMQTRSSLVEVDGEEHRQIKYEETDPIIDTVLESVASDSERVDHALSNGGSGMQTKENGKKENEIDDEGFRVASDSHDMRLYLPPPSATRGRAQTVPHLSRPLFFELATVPHFNGKCSLPDEQSATEYFTNVRSTNYILHSDDISRSILDGCFAGKKHWLNNAHKTRLIPTRHHSTLQAFVTENGVQLEECGLVLNSSLEHNTISINTEDGREDYHMIKIEL